MFSEIVALGSALYKGISGVRQNRMANKIKPQQVNYQTSPYAAANVGLAQQLFNGRMAGASSAEQNIFANNANANASVNRNATNSAQALALISANQGQTDQALSNLAVQEAQSGQQRAGMLMNANQGMVGEGDKIYQDQLRKYQEDVAAKSALRQSGMNNIYGAMGDLGGLAANLDNNVKQVLTMGAGGGMPMPSMNQPGRAQIPQQAPNTGSIPLPQQGSMQPLRFNYLTGRWE